MLRAGGVLPVGISPPVSSAEKTPDPISPASLADRRPPGSPPFLARLTGAFFELPFHIRNTFGASGARRRRRRGVEGGARGNDGGGTARVFAYPLESRGIGGLEEGGAPMESDLVVAPQFQREEGERALEARHVSRRGHGRAVRTGDVEEGGWRATASRVGLHGSGGGGDGGGPRRMRSACTSAVMAPTRGEGTSGRGKHPPPEGNFWNATTAEAADGADVEYVHSNRMFSRAGSYGGGGGGIDPAEMENMYGRISELVDATEIGSSNNSSPASLRRLECFQ